MTRERNAKLQEAFSNAIVVRFSNPYESGWTHGYVLDIGPKFFLLGLIDDQMRFDGFECFLRSDIRRLRVPDPYEAFAVAALRKRGQHIERKPDVDLTSLPAMLQTAGRLFPLITIHRERVKPDTFEIGTITHISESHLQLLEIGPDAIWDKRPTKIPLNDITRVGFGGGYEEALHLVSGRPKPLKKVAAGNKG